jgi:quinol monooxygenase YgiN
VITDFKINDYKAAVEVLSRAAGYIEQNLPGTLAWDMFADEACEHITMYEEFADESALFEYEETLVGLGYRDELLQYADLAQTVVLGPVSDPRIIEMIRQIGAPHRKHIVGVSRQS